MKISKATLLLVGAVCFQNIFPQTVIDQRRNNFDAGWKHYYGTPLGTPEAVTYNDAGTGWEDICLPYPLKYCTRWLDGVANSNIQETFQRDVAWYRKHFTVPSGWSQKKIFLEFEGSMQVTTVWVNGTNVGQNSVSGYTPFHFDITGSVLFGQDNVFAVQTDNRTNNNVPPDGYMKDYIQFGGLYTDVFMTVLDKIHITFPWEATDAGIRITTPSPSSASATVRVKTSIKNENTASKTVPLTTTILDANNVMVTEMQNSASINAGQTYTFTQVSTAIANPHLWSPSSPYLYKAYTRVYDGSIEVDSCVTRFGIRWFSFNASSGFSINGTPLKLNGENRHHHWPFVGEAVPDLYQRFDAKMLRTCANFVRLSHYPQDPAFLDACDEIGLMVDEPPPTWMETGGTTWMNNLEEAQRRTIRRDRNHPSIIVWEGYINHGSCNTRLRDAARAEDSTRAIGQCDFPHPMCYSGQTANGGGVCSEYPNWQADWRRTGESGMIDETRQWATQYGLAKTNAQCSGMQGWCMFDYNTFHNAYYPDAAPRSICTNGLVDLYRIPKFTYYWYVSEESDSPMIFIANYWTASSATRPVWVYSNCDSVVILVNGVSQGIMTRYTGYPTVDHPPFTRNVTFQSGTLTAQGYREGIVAATQTIRTPGNAAAVRLIPDYTEIPANGSDWVRIVIQVIDASGTVVPTAANSVRCTISGQGKLIGDNPVLMEAGQLIILAQSTQVAGTMTITGSSAGLTDGSTTITTTGSTAVFPAGCFSTAFLSTADKTVRILTGAGEGVLTARLHSMPENATVTVFNLSGKILMKNHPINPDLFSKMYRDAPGVVFIKIKTK